MESLWPHEPAYRSEEDNLIIYLNWYLEQSLVSGSAKQVVFFIDLL